MAEKREFGKWIRRYGERLPAVLVLHEKHGDVYFHVPDLESLAGTALKIVKARMESGYHYRDPSGTPEPKRPDVGEVDSLPEGLKDAARKKLSSWRRNHENWIEEREAWDEVRKAVQEGDGEAAWRVLTDRSDGEYERVSLERYCSNYRC